MSGPIARPKTPITHDRETMESFAQALQREQERDGGMSISAMQRASKVEEEIIHSMLDPSSYRGKPPFGLNHVRNLLRGIGYRTIAISPDPLLAFIEREKDFPPPHETKYWDKKETQEAILVAAKDVDREVFAKRLRAWIENQQRPDTEEFIRKNIRGLNPSDFANIAKGKPVEDGRRLYAEIAQFCEFAVPCKTTPKDRAP